MHRRQGLEGGAGVGQHDLDHPLDQNPLDRRIGPTLDAQGRRAATPPQQHIDDRIDQVGIDRQQAVVVQFLRPEHRQDGWQGNGVQIVAEPDRRDGVETDLDVVRGEVAQRGRHQPHEAVKDDLEHRQPLVADEGGVDDRANAGALSVIPLAHVEAEKAVDLILVEDAFGQGRRAWIIRFGFFRERIGAFGEGRVGHA